MPWCTQEDAGSPAPEEGEACKSVCFCLLACFCLFYSAEEPDILFFLI